MRYEIYSAVNELSGFIDTTGVDKCRVWKTLDSLGIDPLNDVPRWFAYWIYRLLKNSENRIQNIIELDCSCSVIKFDVSKVVNLSIESAFKIIYLKYKEYVDFLCIKHDDCFMLTIGYSVFGCIMSNEVGFDYSSSYSEFFLAKELLKEEFKEEEKDEKEEDLVKNLSAVIYEFVVDIFENGDDWQKDNPLSLKPVNEVITDKKKNIIRKLVRMGKIHADLPYLLPGKLAGDSQEDGSKKLQKSVDEIYKKSLREDKEDKDIVSSHCDADDILNTYNDQEAARLGLRMSIGFS
jgi:hypothetical protein